MSFQKTAIKIALIALIIFSLFFVIMIWNSQSKRVWPPEISSCPDYWKNEDGNVCRNVNNLGNANIEDTYSQTFSGNEYKGPGGFCAKRNWAKDKGVFWGGVTDMSIERRKDLGC